MCYKVRTGKTLGDALLAICFDIWLIKPKLGNSVIFNSVNLKKHPREKIRK